MEALSDCLNTLATVLWHQHRHENPSYSRDDREDDKDVSINEEQDDKT